MNEQPPSQTTKRRFVIPISWKLLGATAVVGAVAAAIAIIGLKRIQTLNDNLTQTVDFLVTNVKLASVLKQDLITVTRAERNMMLAQSKDGTQRFAAVVDEVLSHMDDHLERFDSVVLQEDRPQLELFLEKWAQWRTNHQEVRRWTSMDSDIEAHNISVGPARDAIYRLETALDSIIQQSQQDFDAAMEDGDLQRLVAASRMRRRATAVSLASLQMQRTEKDLILATTEEEMRGYEAMFAPQKKNLENQIDQLAKALSGMGTIDEVQKACQDYFDANDRIQRVAGEKSNFFTYHYVYEVGIPIATECESILDALIITKEDRMQRFRRASQQSYTSARNTLLGFSIFGILVSVAFSFYTGHRVARRLQILTRHATAIQNTGDLSKPTPRLGRDEVGLLAESFDQMRRSLHEYTDSLNEQAARLEELTQSLETKNREMEQFVYTVSHDLKSPLVSCKGLIGLLKEDVAERNYDGIVDSASRLDGATDQLNQIIDDLLMLSRIGRKSLDLSEVDVHAVVTDLITEFSDRITDSPVNIRVQGKIPNVVADKSDVRRVFENLLTNALKYGCKSENATITFGGSTRRREVRYFVHDDGPGIDPKYHGRVFGLFQRLETEQPGTGLGLASVAKIMSMHGGRVWLESEPGEGATFWVAFPHLPRSTNR